MWIVRHTHGDGEEHSWGWWAVFMRIIRVQMAWQWDSWVVRGTYGMIIMGTYGAERGSDGDGEGY